MKYLIMMFCLLPGWALAGNVYRCMDHAGHVSYQSSKCAVGQRTDRVIGFSPEPVVAAAAPVLTDGHPTKRKIRHSNPYRASKASKARLSACAKSKANREGQLKRLGLRRTFDDLRRIDEVVRGRCGG